MGRNVQTVLNHILLQSLVEVVFQARLSRALVQAIPIVGFKDYLTPTIIMNYPLHPTAPVCKLSF